MRKTFDIFFEGDQLLDVLVLSRGGRKYRVVDDDAVNGGINIRGEDCVFNFFLVNFSEIKLEATV
jgi:hypothetical protein